MKKPSERIKQISDSIAKEGFVYENPLLIAVIQYLDEQAEKEKS